MPAAEDRCGAASEQLEFKFRKSKRPHLFAGVITLLVTVEYSLPSASEVIAGNENRVSGARIAVHVPFNISAVPGGNLCVKHGPNGRDAFVLAL